MIISILITLFTLLLTIPVCIVFVQTVFATLFRAKRLETTINSNLSVGVLIPAHNESVNILPTLQNIIPQLKSVDKLVVVADNCSDDTAAVAKSTGAIVIERSDPLNRGKGFALDFGMQYFAKSPPDILVIMDADCLFAKPDMQRLSSLCFEFNRPLQPLYLMKNSSDAPISLKSKMAEFAWLFKNRVRPYGYSVLGFPCQLMGSGMAFPWKLIQNADLANGNIVEDMKLGIELAKKGYAPVYLDDIEVISYFPSLEQSQKTQNRRWEHGHLSMLMSETIPLISLGLLKRDIKMIAMALDLVVPPLSLLVLLVILSMVLACIGSFCFSNNLALTWSLTMVFLFALSIIMAWYKWARKLITFKQLLFVPLYVIKKLPNYLSFIFKKQKAWVRTDRN